LSAKLIHVMCQGWIHLFLPVFAKFSNTSLVGYVITTVAAHRYGGRTK
jgi:hypothetical protein